MNNLQFLFKILRGAFRKIGHHKPDRKFRFIHEGARVKGGRAWPAPFFFFFFSLFCCWFSLFFTSKTTIMRISRTIEQDYTPVNQYDGGVDPQCDIDGEAMFPDAHKRTNSWFQSASLIVGAMAGAGVLSICEALQNSGWLGILLLFIVLCFNIFTGILLGWIMDAMPSDQLTDYASIGEYVLGRFGRWISHFSQYVTLAGKLCNSIPRLVDHSFSTIFESPHFPSIYISGERGSI